MLGTWRIIEGQEIALLGLIDSEDECIMIFEMSVTTDAVIWHHIPIRLECTSVAM
jgi:hypothetical protein